MITEEKKQSIKAAVQNDESIAAEIEKVETTADFLAIFSSRGIDMTAEEADTLLADVLDNAKDEFSEEDLESVAGGVTWKQATSAFLIGARVGIAARMVYDGCKTGNPYKTYNMGHLVSGQFWK